MDNMKLNSSNLKDATYCEISKRLIIIFHAGGMYEYSNVPREVYESLCSAESAGKYFHTSIKGKFEYKKLS